VLYPCALTDLLKEAQRIISFLKLRVSSLYGRTMELRRITSEGTFTLQPGKKKLIYSFFVLQIYFSNELIN
jgi:hypothetical protein